MKTIPPVQQHYKYAGTARRRTPVHHKWTNETILVRDGFEHGGVGQLKFHSPEIFKSPSMQFEERQTQVQL